MRISKEGEDVTDRPRHQSPDDCEIVSTQYSHPDIKGGQHTNGPQQIFIRKIGGKWIPCYEHSMHKVIKDFIEYGYELFVFMHFSIKEIENGY